MPQKSNSDTSFNELKDLIKTVKEQLEMKKELVLGRFADMGIDYDKLKEVYDKYGGELSEETEDEVIGAIYTKIASDKTSPFLDEYSEDREESPYIHKRMLINECLTNYRELIKDDEEITKIQGDLYDEIHKYADYVTSEEYNKTYDAKAEKLADMLEKNMITGTKFKSQSQRIKETKREIQIIRQRYTLEYLYEDLDDSKDGEENIKRLVERFFDKRRSEYIMKRFSAKCQQMHLSEDAISYLMNIEELFLEEEFHVFNNFYLFFVVNKVAYADRDFPIEIKKPFQNMINLVYHKFYSKEVEDTFLESIRGMLRRFEPYRDRFAKDNRLAPSHPERIAKMKELEAAKKAAYIAKVCQRSASVADHAEELVKYLEGFNSGGLEDILLQLMNGYTFTFEDEKFTLVPPEEPVTPAVPADATSTSVPSGVVEHVDAPGNNQKVLEDVITVADELIKADPIPADEPRKVNINDGVTVYDIEVTPDASLTASVSVPGNSDLADIMMSTLKNGDVAYKNHYINPEDGIKCVGIHADTIPEENYRVIDNITGIENEDAVNTIKECIANYCKENAVTPDWGDRIRRFKLDVHVAYDIANCNIIISGNNDESEEFLKTHHEYKKALYDAVSKAHLSSQTACPGEKKMSDLTPAEQSTVLNHALNEEQWDK